MAIVDGTYTAVTDRPDIAFRIRVDLTRHATFQQVSGDVWQRTGGNDTVLGSFYAEPPILEATATRVRANVTYYDSKATASLVLEEVAMSDGTISLIGTYTPTGTIVPVQTVLHLSLTIENPGYFREVFYEIDYDEATTPPNEVSYALVDKDSGSSRTVTVGGCWDIAGLEVRPTIARKITPSVASYTIDDIQRNMNAFFLSQSSSNRPAVYLFIATKLKDATTLQVDPATLGTMFDSQNRRGAAVFFQAIKDRVEGTSVDFAAEYIRTTVHELGHAFNLPHAFENNDIFANRSADATFMNYPQAYTAGSIPSDGDTDRAARYWRDFQFVFDQSELLSLAHGSYHRVIMGPGNDRYIGQTSEDSTRDAAIERKASRSDLRLNLRLKPDREPADIVEFGEPLYVELKLTNCAADERLVHDVLESHYEFTRFLIERPDQRVVEFKLPYRCSVDPQVASKVLTPERHSLFTTTCLSYGKDGFYFLDPGRYRIQAIHLTPGGLVFSNILTVWVRHPIAGQEDLFVPTFTDDVASYFIVGGSPCRPSVTDTLNEFADRVGMTNLTRAKPAGKARRPRLTPLQTAAMPFVANFRYCEAFADARGAVDVDPRTRKLTRINPVCNHDRVRDALGFAPGLNELVAKPPISNILFGRLMNVFAETLEPCDRERVGKVALNYLEGQDAPDWVANSYRSRWNLA